MTPKQVQTPELFTRASMLLSIIIVVDMTT